MKRVIAVLICFVFAIILVKFVPMPEVLKSPYKAEIVETFETQNTPFRIRINKHIERGGFMPVLGGAYYVFQSESGNCSDQWREITTFRFDDLIEIPRNQVRFANEKVAYLFMIDMYSVTKDGGADWNIYDIGDYLPSNDRCGLIKDLQIDADGKGRIIVKSCGNDSLKIMETTDFGQTWREK